LTEIKTVTYVNLTRFGYNGLVYYLFILAGIENLDCKTIIIISRSLDVRFCQNVMTTNTTDLFRQLRPENRTKVLDAITECIDDVDILIRVGINLAFLINGLMVNLGLSVTVGIIYVIATKFSLIRPMGKVVSCIFDLLCKCFYIFEFEINSGYF
jgi:hypothetical protein